MSSSISGPENTFVVLPAAPYIFPQRPFILPTAPPTFVLVDSNLQTLNKPPYPVVNRINGDVTKTTMVNILPISAYSRPLSATKNRKNNAKSKLDNPKKANKKLKQSTKVTKEPLINKEEPLKSNDQNTKEIVKEQNDQIPLDSSKSNQNENTAITSKKEKNDVSTNDNQKPENKESVDEDLSMKEAESLNLTKPAEILHIPKTADLPKVTEAPVTDKTLPISAPTNVVEKENSTETVEVKIKDTNKGLSKDSVDKDKENKLSNILDTALCENTVDGGNVRLELAEEFLAASPTAAFLMSFPLVSGNRADSPAEDTHTNAQVHSKDNHTRRHEVASQTINYFEKTNANDSKLKPTCKAVTTSSIIHHSKENYHHKYADNHVASKQTDAKHSINVVTTSENPFLNLPMSSLIPSTCTLTDSSYALDFDCTVNKTIPSQTTSFASSNNLFYKSDPFSTVKNTIYSTSSISSGHEFNSFGLYPCAMEKYSSKTKSDYPNVEDNLMKIGSSRLTYDIDLGWSHKGFDFVNCTSAPNAFSKDSILNTTNTSYSSSYNPFNPEFHMPLVSSTSGKKDTTAHKASSSLTETLTTFYTQPTSLWSEDMNYYNNSNSSKPTKPHHYLPVDHSLSNNKVGHSKVYESKQMPNLSESTVKTSNVAASQQVAEKYTKKSPTKMHINWMTSEVRPMQSHCNPPHIESKEGQKHSYTQLDHTSKKIDPNEGNYFPISMHNFSQQITQDELIWPSTRPAGTTEITMEPPPINLPTLVGDLALGPHDKKKTDGSSRSGLQSDLQNGSNSFFVTQLMNRTTDNSIPSRYQGSEIEIPKTVPVKQNSSQTTSESHHKTMSRIENHISQPYYDFHESKSNSYDTMSQYSQKAKPNKPDKSSKVQKNSYSAEALIRGATCNQKLADTNSLKFAMPSQKYTDFNMSQDSVAQVSHFPQILDYSDNSSYTGQQFSATTLYNSTTNTISNSFYSNFMPGTSNLMSGNYTSGPFSGDFIDYNQTECNYSNHKYEELKMRNNPTTFQSERVLSNYKSSRRESATKHKLECSKKDSNKKYQSKRAKLNTESEEWNDSNHILWQNKTPTKRHHNLMSEDIPFPNYGGNQMPGQYQPDFFNSHLMPSNMQSMSHNVDRSLASFPATSRANFNLSTIFPEITMVRKKQIYNLL